MTSATFWRVRAKDPTLFDASGCLGPYLGINIRSAPTMAAKTSTRLSPGAVFEAMTDADCPAFLRLVTGDGYIPKFSPAWGMLVDAMEERDLDYDLVARKESGCSDLMMDMGIDGPRPPSRADTSSPSDPIPRAETPQETVSHAMRTNLSRQEYLGEGRDLEESEYLEIVQRGPTPDQLREQMHLETEQNAPEPAQEDEEEEPEEEPIQSKVENGEWVAVDQPVTLTYF